MLKQWDEVAGVLMVLTPLAAVVVGALAWAGLLRRSALANGPLRQVGFEAIDVAVAMVLPVMAVLTGVALAWSGPAPAAHDGPLPTGGEALQNLLMGQAATQLPFAAWFLVRSRRTEGGWRRVGLVPQRPGRDVGAGLLGVLVALTVVLALNTVCAALQLSISGEVPAIAHPLLRLIRDESSPLVRAGLIASAFVLAPLLEEMIFRGLLQTALLELLGWSQRWPVVICAAAAFAAVHLAVVPWYVMPGLFVLGLILGWLYERTGSLWPSFVVHAGFNGFNTLVAILMEMPA